MLKCLACGILQSANVHDEYCLSLYQLRLKNPTKHAQAVEEANRLIMKEHLYHSHDDYKLQPVGRER